MLDSLPMSENLAYRVKRCCAKLLTHKSNFNRHLGARRIELLTRGARSDAHNGRVVFHDAGVMRTYTELSPNGGTWPNRPSATSASPALVGGLVILAICAASHATVLGMTAFRQLVFPLRSPSRRSPRPNTSYGF